jgi:hypothetical protein
MEVTVEGKIQSDIAKIKNDSSTGFSTGSHEVLNVLNTECFCDFSHTNQSFGVVLF